MPSPSKLLRVAYLTGAVTDALAIVPMLSPSVAALIWRIEERSAAFRFAAASAAFAAAICPTGRRMPTSDTWRLRQIPSLFGLSACSDDLTRPQSVEENLPG